MHDNVAQAVFGVGAGSLLFCPSNKLYVRRTLLYYVVATLLTTGESDTRMNIFKGQR